MKKSKSKFELRDKPVSKKPVDESHLFPENKIPAPSPEQAAKISNLNKTRDAFSKAVLEFRALLKDPTLSNEHNQVQKERTNKILADLNGLAGDLEALNRGEGIFSLAILSLHGLLGLRDEINDLKFQNLQLFKKIKALEEPSDKAQ